MNDDGHTSSIRDKILTITVKKGWKPGTRITFPEEGDQGPNNVPGLIELSPKTHNMLWTTVFALKLYYPFRDSVWCCLKMMKVCIKEFYMASINALQQFYKRLPLTKFNPSCLSLFLQLILYLSSKTSHIPDSDEMGLIWFTQLRFLLVKLWQDVW